MSRIDPRLLQGYADLWTEKGVSHELTLSLGYFPRSYQAEDFLPILKRVVKEASRQVRSFPKRTAYRISPDTPGVPFLAGFYEGTDRAGQVYPHWHGGVALRAGEEPMLRAMLWECFGEDARDRLKPWEASRTVRPLVVDRRAKPTFHLVKMTTPEHYVRYANKKNDSDHIIHWTTRDILA